MKTETRPRAPRQLAMHWDPNGLEELSGKERARAVRLLAQLLLEASGRVDEEDHDENG